MAVIAIAIALLVISAALWGACKGTKAAVGITAGAFRRHVAPRPAEDILTVVAASIATGVSAQGMWRFTGDVLGFDGPLQLLLFAFIEVAVITSAVRARRNMRENFSAGIDGAAVWALTVLTAVLSAMDAHSLAEAIFRLAAPLVAAWLWERGMAVERHRITGRKRINWRLTPERMLVRVGLAEVSDRTASEVDTFRRLTRVALAAKRVWQLRQAGASPRKIRSAITRRDRALDKAVEHTNLARDKASQGTLLDIVTSLGGSESLSAILETAAAPWADLDHPAVRPANEPAEMPREAREAIAAYEGWKRPTIMPFVLTQPHTTTRPDASTTMTATVSDTGRLASTLAHTPADPATVFLHAPPVSESVSAPRPEECPLKDGDVLKITDTDPHTAPLTVTGSDSDQERENDDEETDERGRPNEQDNQVAEEWIRRRCRGTNGVGKRPSWNDVAARYSFSVGWGGNRVKAVQERMTAQGYTFLDDGTVLAPSKTRTDSPSVQDQPGDREASSETAAKKQLLHALALPADEPGPYTAVNGSKSSS
ncbi:hypothetical protein [Streptosporangium sp. NPDC051022]|uniref:hypothetical protein n=1 Tax=Streptosporangium sp. NPDC051022 TaxID=3155752 RepID=UPI00343FBBB7